MVTKVTCCNNFQQCPVIINCNLGQLTKSTKGPQFLCEQGSLTNPMMQQQYPEGTFGLNPRNGSPVPTDLISFLPRGAVCEELGECICPRKVEISHSVTLPVALNPRSDRTPGSPEGQRSLGSRGLRG